MPTHTHVTSRLPDEELMSSKPGDYVVRRIGDTLRAEVELTGAPDVDLALTSGEVSKDLDNLLQPALRELKRLGVSQPLIIELVSDLERISGIEIRRAYITKAPNGLSSMVIVLQSLSDQFPEVLTEAFNVPMHGRKIMRAPDESLVEFKARLDSMRDAHLVTTLTARDDEAVVTSKESLARSITYCGNKAGMSQERTQALIDSLSKL